MVLAFSFLFIVFVLAFATNFFELVKIVSTLELRRVAYIILKDFLIRRVVIYIYIFNPEVFRTLDRNNAR